MEGEEKVVAETRCDELRAMPIPSICTAQGQEGEKNRNEVEPRKKGGVGERCMYIGFGFISR